MLKTRRTFISSKYISMLLSGTVLMILTAAMGMVDTLVAGIVLGEDAVAGVCLVLPLYSLASFFSVAFSYGVPILYAREIGAFRRKEADRCFGVGLTVTVLTGAAMFAMLQLFGNAFLRSYHPGSRVLANAEEYLSWMAATVLILPLNELLDGMVFTDGDEKTTLAANVAQGLVKVVLSFILCRQMGTGGLALASFVSFAVSILISCAHFLSRGNTLRLNLSFSPGVFFSVVKFGIVDASTHLFVSLFVAFINYYVAAAFGPEVLIVVSVITLLKEAQLFFEGIGEAITPIVGTYLGEENYPGIRKVWKLANRSMWIESAVTVLLVCVSAPLVIRLLGITDPVLGGYAEWGLRLLSFTLVFTCRMFLDSSYFILVERIRAGVFDSFLRDLFPAVPLAVLGGRAGGIYGMFIGLMIAPAVSYLLSVLYIRLRYGRENYPLFLAEREKGKNIKMFELKVLPETVVQTRDIIGAALRENGCPDRLVNRTMLIFEELFMSVYEANPGKTVLAECAVEIGESIRMITKDDGKIVDLTDTDRNVGSLRTYTVSNLLAAHTARRVHLMALSYNRNALEIR